MGPELILSLLALCLWPLGFVLGRRLTGPAPQSAGAGQKSITLIVPARNEEGNLPALLESLKNQAEGPVEIIVVDDGSTDQTAARARAGGARVIPSAPLPEGWRGKTWACHQGAREATGELLLFVDADVWFEPGAFLKIRRLYPGGAWSLGPWHAVRKPYEDFSLFFNLMMTAGTVPGGLFGPMLLVDRDSHRRVGGHERVRGRILENLWLAQEFRNQGIPVASHSGRGLLCVRMYPGGMGDLWAGWSKAFVSGAGRTPGGVMILVVAWMTGLMLAWIALLWGSWVSWVVYGACAGQTAWLARRTGSFGLWASAVYPVPLMFFFAVFGRAAVRQGQPVQWKGRSILDG